MEGQTKEKVMDWKTNVPLFNKKQVRTIEALGVLGGVLIGVALHKAYWDLKYHFKYGHLDD